jgi:UDP-N-acetyl-D-glucosamine/UDP-N-acetyl-D-galactosamine dehydrogenase
MEKIGIIGLGYVGLPLAVEFGKVMDVVGFDINQQRIDELKKGYDRTHEVEIDELNQSKGLTYSTNLNDLKSVNYFIVTVPTPVDQYKKPDLTPLISASKTVSTVLKKGDKQYILAVRKKTVCPSLKKEVA